jgi:phospholipid/cholesterol/gamma-HCH transport system ATP-binding protein
VATEAVTLSAGQAGSVAAVELVDVVKEFGSVRVLDQVTFSVPPGAVTVLLGPSGAGKTVTIQHILGLMRPTAGTVRVSGEDLAAISESRLNELRHTMSVVLQGTLPFTCGLFSSLTVYENVASTLRIRNPERDPAWIHARTIGCLEQISMADRASAFPHQLSAGMCKRLAIARAIALEPQLLIADDFDSGLDGVRLSLMCEMLYRAHLDTGATILLSTHDLTTARKLADHLVVIHDATVLASGEADEVFASEDPAVSQIVTGTATGPVLMDSTPLSAEPPAPQAVGSRAKRAVLLALITLATLNVWTGAPVLALWLGAQAQATLANATPGSITILGLCVTVAALTAIELGLTITIGRLNHAHATLTGARPEIDRRLPWQRGSRDTHATELTGPEKAMITVVVVCAITVEIVFLFFTHPALR